MKSVDQFDVHILFQILFLERLILETKTEVHKIKPLIYTFTNTS
jgi:hypothetical protein